MRLLALSFFSLVFAPAASAFVDLQVSVGRESSDLHVDETIGKTVDGKQRDIATFTGNEYQFSALISPFPTLPMAFGGYFSVENLKNESTDINEQLNSMKAGALVAAFVPMMTWQPYVKGGYDLYGSTHYSKSAKMIVPELNVTEPIDGTVNVDGTVTGYSGSLGLMWHAAPTMAIFIEGTYAKESFTAKSTTQTVKGSGTVTEIPDPSPQDFESRAVLLGLNLGV